MDSSNYLLESPQWINSDFLKQVLEFNGALTNVSIHDFQITPATAPGEHFASIMFRIRITYSAETALDQKCSIIIKTLPAEDGLKKDVIPSSSMDLFANEIFMYETVLGDCVNILISADYKDLLAAKMIYKSMEPRKIIVFEDLTECGYLAFPKTLPNEDDANVIFSKLGQFHAATYRMLLEGRKDLKLNGTAFNLSKVQEMSPFSHGISYLCELVDTLPGFEEEAEKLRKITYNDLVTKCVESVNKPGLYNVLNHGDYHIKNMMFKYNNDNAIPQVTLVDFQICHWGSPAFDLYHISSVIPQEMHERVFQIYFNTFSDVLKKSGFKGPFPTYKQLQQELESLRHFDLFFLITHTPLLCVDRSQVKIQLEDLFQNVHAMKVFYKTPEYIAFVKQALPCLLKTGVLNNLIQKH